MGLNVHRAVTSDALCLDSAHFAIPLPRWETPLSGLLVLSSNGDSVSGYHQGSACSSLVPVPIIIHRARFPLAFFLFEQAPDRIDRTGPVPGR